MSFEDHRPRLFQIAYGMLGTIGPAEELVQEAWIRYQAHQHEVRDPGPWLRRVVSRLALDELSSARARRETYVGPWLPEPIPTDSADPERTAVLAEELSFATMTLLEALTPAERAAFLLRVVFDIDYAEVARLLDRSQAATRQLVRRARQHLGAGERRYPADDPAHTELLGAFMHAVVAGDLDALTQLLADDAVATTDGGGVVQAALRPIHGADAVARFVVGLQRKFGAGVQVRPARLNHQPALVLSAPDGELSAVVFTIEDGRIAAIHSVRHPDKVAHLR